MTRPPSWRGKPAIRDRARQLRRTPTPTEALLWEQLRNRASTGRKWRRQHPLGPFIADFFCAEHRLVVELDGVVHDAQVERDAERTERLEREGYRVLRFPNAAVERDIEQVLVEIRAAIGR